MSTQLPQLCGLLTHKETQQQRDPLLFHPIQKTEVYCMAGWQGVAGRPAARALKGHQRDADPTNHFMHSIRKPASELLLAIPHLEIPPTGPWAPPMLHVSHPHPRASHSWLPEHAPKGSKSKHLQMASEHVQKAGRILEESTKN